MESIKLTKEERQASSHQRKLERQEFRKAQIKQQEQQGKLTKEQLFYYKNQEKIRQKHNKIYNDRKLELRKLKEASILMESPQQILEETDKL